jgi:Autoinducer binding domain
MGSVSVGSAAMKLTYKILGIESEDLLDILKQLAPEIGVGRIAYVRIGSHKSMDSSLLASVVTYPKEWMRHYFVKQYFLIDPVLQYASNRSFRQFDWEDLLSENPATKEFFADAIRTRLGAAEFRSLYETERTLTLSFRLPARCRDQIGRFLKARAWINFITCLR